MLRNYYYLNRAITELNFKLKGSRVTEIFSQDKNLLMLSIPDEQNPYRHLVVSTAAALPFLFIKDEHRKAKKNVIDYSALNLPQEILEFRIAQDDRIITIDLSKSNLVFSMMGGRSNVYFLQDQIVVEKFKKSKSEDDILKRINSHQFIKTPVYHNINDAFFDGFDQKTIRNEYSYIAKEIIHELSSRVNKEAVIENEFHKILSELYEGKIKVLFDDSENKLRMIPETFQLLNDIKEVKIFNDYNSAIKYFLSTYYSADIKHNYKKEIEKVITKELSKLSNKLNKLTGRIENGDRSEDYYKTANLLLLNRSSIVKGKDILELVNDDGNIVRIQINPKHTPQQVIDYYFEKAKDEKTNFSKSLLLFGNTKERFNSLLRLEQRFKNTNDKKELISIRKELKIKDMKSEREKMDFNAKLKQYLIDDKYTVLIGRDSKSNDLLSIKIAKQNDYWFHARGLPGSHVVLRIDNVKEGVPKNIIKTVAQIAAFHSKAKTASVAPVAYTFGKYVRKKKGMEPGKVSIIKERVLLVKPDIPSNAVLVTEE